ncbi:MAG: YifB family Mg chelatase-like AAA ATPase [Ruminococcus sp.]|jgi:magnesium chelatase family protein|nr:YifB family Mg chelatase-like AAA ATPase [Ruminococcus sp.]
MFKKVNSCGLMGINAFHVETEMEISKGLPDFTIIGLGDAAVRESRDRVKSAMRSSGLRFPEAKVTVNLAPADVKKSGSLTDLSIIAALLAITGEITADLSDSVFIGEVSLGGDIKSVSGVLPMTILSKREGYKNIYVSDENAFEASVVDGINIYGVKTVRDMLDHFKGIAPIKPHEKYVNSSENIGNGLDFEDVKGHSVVKKALEFAAAGGHNLLMLGPPGSGKSMLAKRMPTILPPLTFDESIDITGVYSVAGLIDRAHPLITSRPFRSPHHNISLPALTGGGSVPKPGEISLAHRGVLFLDELPEFNRSTLEALRQPLEDHEITVSRTGGKFTYPCTIMLVAAMNPCPCGYFGSTKKQCSCTDTKKKQYISKISGPLLDRFDIQVEVAEVDYEKLASGRKEEPSEAIRERVCRAREIQNERYKNTSISCNAEITDNLIDEICVMTPEAKEQFGSAFEALGLSGRAFSRVLKVARTIADTENSKLIEKKHINRAVNFRTLDRKYWSN